MMPVCYLVSEITIERDNSGQQISSDISICGVFTTKDKANSCVTTWHDREYVTLDIGDFDSYKLSKLDGLSHLVASTEYQSWEVSTEMIEMNDEFRMSLLDPAAPEHVYANVEVDQKPKKRKSTETPISTAKASPSPTKSIAKEKADKDTNEGHNRSSQRSSKKHTAATTTTASRDESSKITPKHMSKLDRPASSSSKANRRSINSIPSTPEIDSVDRTPLQSDKKRKRPGTGSKQEISDSTKLPVSSWEALSYKKSNGPPKSTTSSSPRLYASKSSSHQSKSKSIPMSTNSGPSSHSHGSSNLRTFFPPSPQVATSSFTAPSKPGSTEIRTLLLPHEPDTRSQTHATIGGSSTTAEGSAKEPASGSRSGSRLGSGGAISDMFLKKTRPKS